MPESDVPSGSYDEWRTHPRLVRHASLFAESSDQGALLARYHKKAGCSSVRDSTMKQLKRHICHVGAWVALLPSHVAFGAVGVGELSPTKLLAQLLRRRGKTPLTPWLRGILHLVALRLHEVHSEGKLSSQQSENWKELKRALPRNVWKSFRAQCPVMPSDAASAKEGGRSARENWPEVGEVAESNDKHGACTREHGPCDSNRRPHLPTMKLVRAWQNRMIASVAAMHLTDRDQQVILAQERASAALECQDPELMLEAVEHCIAALSPPRSAPTGAKTGKSMSEAAKLRLRRERQSQLRLLLADLLRYNCGGLDILDPYTRKLLAVPFGRLRALLEHRNISGTWASDEWALLSHVLAVAGNGATRAPESIMLAHDTSSSRNKRNLEDEVRSDARKTRTIHKTRLRHFVRQVLGERGGRATIAELNHSIAARPAMKLELDETFPLWPEKLLSGGFLNKFCRRVSSQHDEETAWELVQGSRGVALRSEGAAAAVKFRQGAFTWRLTGPCRSSVVQAKKDRERWDQMRNAMSSSNVEEIVRAGFDSLGFHVTSKRLGK
mmetsp:Transcript_91975/g.297549  ORF Transcript_91975/g.297549 Transcript_91975/m.297549 type:complete len:555 (+) Transcript_91975:99-1763(+)